MTVLGVDTATRTASVALVEGGKLLREAAQADEAGGASTGLRGKGPHHAEIILPLIEELLNASGRSVREVSALAVSIGPGSFTGLRIGLSTVKGMAYGWGIPVVGVPTLEALASRVTEWHGLICPVLDARKGEMYAALFERRGGFLTRIEGDLVCAPRSLTRRLDSIAPGKACLFVGEGAQTYRKPLHDALGERAICRTGEDLPSMAAAVALLARERLEIGAAANMDSVGSLAPLYLRPAEAELNRGARTGNL